MRPYAPTALLLTALAACNPADQPATTAAATDEAARHAATAAADARALQTAAPAGTAPAADSATTTSPAAAMSPSTAPPAPYEVRGIIDPGIDNEIAFALKIPRGWQMQQSFTREWNGATPVAQIYARIASPDGQRQIEFLPERPYYFVDGPMARNMRQMAAMSGMPPQHNAYELAPMPALAYVKQVLLPHLAQRGLRLQASGEHQQALPPLNGAHRSSGYVDGRLPNGRLARVECVITTTSNPMNGEVYYNWSALPTITQAAAADLPATFAYVGAARASLVYNPGWVRQNQQLVSNGQQSNQEETRKRQAIQRDLQEHQRKTNEEITANRQHSEAQRNAAFSDMMRGEARYDDPSTGQRVQTEDRYSHVYQDRSGVLHGSNAPLDAGAMDWQELQRVETKDY